MILGTELVDPSKWRISQQIDSSLTQAMATVAHKDGVTNSSKDGRFGFVRVIIYDNIYAVIMILLL